ASGDLVRDGDAFRWRGAPRGGASAIALEEVIAERLETLDDESRRFLECICVAPEGAARELIEDVAGLDGLTERARARSEARLAREAWLTPEGQWPVISTVATAASGSGTRTGATTGSDGGSGAVQAAGDRAARPHPSSSSLRRVLVRAMPPARLGEL